MENGMKKHGVDVDQDMFRSVRWQWRWWRGWYTAICIRHERGEKFGLAHWTSPGFLSKMKACSATSPLWKKNTIHSIYKFENIRRRKKKSKKEKGVSIESNEPFEFQLYLWEFFNFKMGEGIAWKRSNFHSFKRCPTIFSMEQHTAVAHG